MFKVRDPEPRPYYFADKATAEAFRAAIPTSRARIKGRPVLRKTLEHRRYGSVSYRDTRHAGGYAVTVRAFSLADTAPLGELARDFEALPAPHTY